MAEETAACAGVGSVSLGRVTARAGVSTAVFHEQFADREACLLAAFELGVERARRRLLDAYETQPHWLDAVKAALAAALEFIEQEPALGALLVAHSLGGGRRLLRRRAELLEALARVVDRGRLELPAGRQGPPPVIAEGVVGAVLAVLGNRLLARRPAGVRDLFGPLVSIVVLPYLGAGVARRELARSAPLPRALAGVRPAGAEAGREPGAGVRLTYRTARVLGAIGEYPGASNREVAERAGIVDQGQTSKLLARLRARGLIVEVGEGRARGAPNAWRLTERGELLLGESELSPAARSSPNRS
ncbi:MAG TPA: helix-turn-helix domain-containing protein [Solirubrobacteraceae bacterium]|nr:helix-turn-helix domain-containing protein [Solirubrobacteraceae bacterium]